VSILPHIYSKTFIIKYKIQFSALVLPIDMENLAGVSKNWQGGPTRIDRHFIQASILVEFYYLPKVVLLISCHHLKLHKITTVPAYLLVKLLKHYKVYHIHNRGSNIQIPYFTQTVFFVCKLTVYLEEIYNKRIKDIIVLEHRLFKLTSN
jgi:hypothetical protein